MAKSLSRGLALRPSIHFLFTQGQNTFLLLVPICQSKRETTRLTKHYVTLLLDPRMDVLFSWAGAKAHQTPTSRFNSYHTAAPWAGIWAIWVREMEKKGQSWQHSLFSLQLFGRGPAPEKAGDTCCIRGIWKFLELVLMTCINGPRISTVAFKSGVKDDKTKSAWESAQEHSGLME
jgi:hypothetical protein